MATPRQRGRGSNRVPSKATTFITKTEAKQMVKSLISKDVEDKHLNYSFSSTISSVGFLNDLSAVVQGVGIDQRIGDEIYAKSLDLTMGFHGGDTTNFIRVSVVRWLMNDSADVASLVDVFLNPANPSLSNFSPTKPNRFRVVFDWQGSIGTGGTDAISFKRHIRLNSAVSFNASGATTGIGHYYLIVSSDSSLASDPTMVIEAVFNYVDA